MNEKRNSTEVGQEAVSTYAEWVLRRPDAFLLTVNGLFRAMFQPLCVALSERGLTPVVELYYENEAIAARCGRKPTVPAEQARVHIGMRDLASAAEVASFELTWKEDVPMQLSRLANGTPSRLLALIAMSCENQLGWDGGLLDEHPPFPALQAQEIRALIASKVMGYETVIEEILLNMGRAEATLHVEEYFNACPAELTFLNFDAWGRFAAKERRSAATNGNGVDGYRHLG